MEQEWVAYSFNYPLVVIYSGFKTYVTDLLPLKKESNNLICLKRVLNLTATYSHTYLYNNNSRYRWRDPCVYIFFKNVKRLRIRSITNTTN